MGAHGGHSEIVERRAIEYIPLAERHGRPNTLLTIWFASNAQITAVATGLLASVRSAGRTRLARAGAVSTVGLG